MGYLCNLGTKSYTGKSSGEGLVTYSVPCLRDEDVGINLRPHQNFHLLCETLNCFPFIQLVDWRPGGLVSSGEANANCHISHIVDEGSGGALGT